MTVTQALLAVGVAGRPVVLTGRLAGDDGRGRSGRGRASQEQTLSGTGARVYTAQRGWLGVVTGINAASTGGVLVQYNVRSRL